MLSFKEVLPNIEIFFLATLVNNPSNPGLPRCESSGKWSPGRSREGHFPCARLRVVSGLPPSGSVLWLSTYAHTPLIPVGRVFTRFLPGLEGRTGLQKGHKEAGFGFEEDKVVPCVIV